MKIRQREIQFVQQQYVRNELSPAQLNDPSEYNRLYIVASEPCGPTIISCPIQNSLSDVGITEVELQRRLSVMRYLLCLLDFLKKRWVIFVQMSKLKSKLS